MFPDTWDRMSYDRDSCLSGLTKEEHLGCEKNLFVTCNFDGNNCLREVFAVLGKPGGCIRSFIDALGIVISLALQEGVSSEKIIKKLKMIRCPNPSVLGEDKKYSCPDAIARVMEESLMGDIENSSIKRDNETMGSNEDSEEIEVDSTGHSPECPECGGSLIYQEGCLNCKVCGYSKCS